MVIANNWLCRLRNGIVYHKNNREKITNNAICSVGDGRPRLGKIGHVFVRLTDQYRHGVSTIEDIDVAAQRASVPERRFQSVDGDTELRRIDIMQSSVSLMMEHGGILFIRGHRILIRDGTAHDFHIPARSPHEGETRIRDFRHRLPEFHSRVDVRKIIYFEQHEGIVALEVHPTLILGIFGTKAHRGQAVDRMPIPTILSHLSGLLSVANELHNRAKGYPRVPLGVTCLTTKIYCHLM